MPTRTMLQHYIIEALKRAIVTEGGPGRVVVFVPELPHIVVEGETAGEAEEHLAEALWGWVIYQRALRHPVPVIADVDLNSERADRLLEIEHGVVPGSLASAANSARLAEKIVLTGSESLAFAQTLIDPPEPNASLVALFRRHEGYAS